MALQGQFVVNNASFSPLTIFGTGTFMAFSGDNAYRNRGGCVAVPDAGPIPAGLYWIVDRPAGGVRSRAWTLTKDAWNTAAGSPSNHAEWFALYRDDGLIDDYTWINGIKRGNFRLHPVGGVAFLWVVLLYSIIPILRPFALRCYAPNLFLSVILDCRPMAVLR
ncbi:membrane protein [Yersinia pseudotuberculosis]|uniref:Membrane protein n=1 Tax=Yersinia pseudotuberculosis TaxID=633 RepID=A0A380QB82_YERPU|nr:membrane protein [Yersinia pseudotuberculosis]